MKNEEQSRSHSHSIKDEIAGVLAFVIAIWVVSIAGFWWKPIVETLALVPRTPSGLPGILTMPLVHKDFGHLIGNSIPLVILLMLLAGSRGRSWLITGAIVVVGGSLLWLFGGSGPHIGASGLVLGLITYLISSGLFERRLVPMIVSLVVGLMYGWTLLWNLIPTGTPEISWTGHVFGAIAGVIAGYAFASPPFSKMIRRGGRTIEEK